MDVEWRMILLVIVDGDRVTRCELFDETDLDAAIVRFEELCRPASRLENAATRVIEQFLAHFAARDWDAMAELIDEDFCSDDRRRGINAGIRRGREVEMANWRATAEVWMSDMRAAVVATRGERLALFRFTFVKPRFAARSVPGCGAFRRAGQRRLPMCRCGHFRPRRLRNRLCGTRNTLPGRRSGRP